MPRRRPLYCPGWTCVTVTVPESSLHVKAFVPRKLARVVGTSSRQALATGAPVCRSVKVVVTLAPGTSCTTTEIVAPLVTSIDVSPFRYASVGEKWDMRYRPGRTSSSMGPASAQWMPPTMTQNSVTGAPVTLSTAVTVSRAGAASVSLWVTISPSATVMGSARLPDDRPVAHCLPNGVSKLR